MVDGSRALLRLTLTFAFAFAVSACDSGPKEPPPDLLKGQRQSMERAKGVEQTLQKSADQRREEADRAGK
ncbi:MAG: hypothetical protein WCE38_14790 [Burkholderiales bacterium]